MTMPFIRRALQMIDLVLGVILVIWVTRYCCSRDAWRALKHQAHAPDMIGTLTFDTFLDWSGKIIAAVIVVRTIMLLIKPLFDLALEGGIHIPQREDYVRLCDRASLGLHNAYLTTPWGRRKADELSRSYLDNLVERMPRLLDLTSEQYRNIASARCLLRLTRAPEYRDYTTSLSSSVDNEYFHENLILHDLVGLSSQLHERWTSFPLNSNRWANPFDYKSVIESLGGTLYVFGDAGSCILWDEPTTPYSMARLRLYCASTDLVLCDRAGEVADTLHDKLAAESRLWSYKGYRVAGESGTTPEAIQRAAIVEVQQIAAAAMIASTPEVVVA